MHINWSLQLVRKILSPLQSGANSTRPLLRQLDWASKLRKWRRTGPLLRQSGLLLTKCHLSRLMMTLSSVPIAEESSPLKQQRGTYLSVSTPLTSLNRLHNSEHSSETLCNHRPRLKIPPLRAHCEEGQSKKLVILQRWLREWSKREMLRKRTR
jgi:hypothetical protein